MDIDLHCHAKLSKKTQFSLRHLIKLQQAAKRTGLQAIALTEHFNTQGFDEIYETLDRLYPYREDYYDLEGLKVFCGMEIDISEGGHVLLIGKREDVRNLHRELSPFLYQKTYPSLAYLLEEANKREMIKIGAHPLRSDNQVGRLPDGLLKQFDYLEFNGKDFKKGNMVLQLAGRLGLPVAAGSDTHHWLQVGCVRNRMETDCATVNQIKDCIKQGNYKIIISPGINLKLTGARLVKKILKSI